MQETPRPKAQTVTLPQLTRLDRLISTISPERAMARYQARVKLSMYEAIAGGYSSGKRNKATTATWNPGTGSANADTIADLPMLRARSRDQLREAPVAIGAINTACSSIVGTGLSMAPAIHAGLLGLTQAQADAWASNTRTRFENWAASTDCDVAQKLNFYGQQELALRTTLESGDSFVVTPLLTRDGQTTLALQLIEADRVCNPNRASNTETLIEGIETDASTGASIACHIARVHPGELRTAGNTWSRVEFRGGKTGRRNVLHLFRPLRPGQVRGVPWIAPILEPLKQISRYTEAELNAAVTNALFSVFIKMDPQAFQDLFDQDAQQTIASKAESWSGEMESGKAVNLLPGESIETASPGRPNAQFDPFVMSILRQIGMALEIPVEVLIMHFQSSYSAARGAMLMAWKFFRGRRDWLATILCQPVYELWLDNEIAAGRIAAPGYFSDAFIRAAWRRAIWTGDGPGSLDPSKEVAAAEKRVQLGISTLQAESILHDGVDWDAKHAQRAKEAAARRRDGLEPAAGASTNATAVDIDGDAEADQSSHTQPQNAAWP